MLDRLGPERSRKVERILAPLKESAREPLSFLLAVDRARQAERLASSCVIREVRPEHRFAESLSRIMTSPWTGIPLLLFILYAGLYLFVGRFGAGTLVNWFEGHVFATHLNPWFEKVFLVLIPWEWLRGLFTGEFGILTLGLRYAVALILPIVATFFLAFAVIEDSGYLPRLSLLVDRVFKLIGLSGRAVIPMVLGLGCDTMATLVTRTLATKRERVIATLLLALAIPCSAQLGVILALLSSHPAGLLIWAGVLGLVFLAVGWLSSKIMPGTPASFYMEIPPLRWPRLGNVLLKTWSRVRWYFLEILPVFLAASVLIWLGQVSGVFGFLTRLLVHPVRMLGLPDEASVAFFFGFFRRDYGAAGLYDLQTAGLLTGNQVVVASVVITLFLPCVAQFLVTIKERGWKSALAIGGLTLAVSFLAGLALHGILAVTGVKL
jgi:ferrous iron transport protein B